MNPQDSYEPTGALPRHPAHERCRAWAEMLHRTCPRCGAMTTIEFCGESGAVGS